MIPFTGTLEKLSFTASTGIVFVDVVVTLIVSYNVVGQPLELVYVYAIVKVPTPVTEGLKE
ncbi:hypothetical protein D3C86_1669780 [compost metagenome]